MHGPAHILRLALDGACLLLGLFEQLVELLEQVEELLGRGEAEVLVPQRAGGELREQFAQDLLRSHAAFSRGEI